MRKVLVVLTLVSLVGFVGCEMSETTRNTYFPPDDYLVPLGEVGVDLSEAGLELRIPVIHKYPGTHSVSVEVPITQANEFPLRADFGLAIRVERGERTFFHRSEDLLRSPFTRGDVGGFRILYYDVPEDLPRDVPLMFVLTVTKTDPEFAARFDSITLSVRKSSDK